jgi:hypothetical protein
VADRRASALLRRRLVAQGLAGPPIGTGADGPVAVARRLLATQGQDPRGFRLAVRARTRETTGADVGRALTEERSLLVTWLNRGTLHLVTREDYPLLQALIAPWQRTAAMTRLARLGIDAARWLAVPLRHVRPALGALGSRIEEGDGGLVAPRLPAPRLLGAFDPLLMGWRSREDVLGGHEPDVVSGGVFRGIGLAGGRAAGVWRFAGGIDFRPFGPLDERVAGAFERDVTALLRFLGR